MTQTLRKTRPRRPPAFMTYEEFLARDWENPHVEWVDGRVEPMSPVSFAHSDVHTFVLTLLNAYVGEKRLGKVVCEPFQMKTGRNLPGRAPDIIFMSNETLKRLDEMHLEGPADLVVEVVSPRYRRKDRVTKYGEYETGGVREYWVIDPARRLAEFFVLGDDGRFQELPADSEGRFHSTVLPDVWIGPAWLWQTPMPTTLDVLRLWGLI